MIRSTAFMLVTAALLAVPVYAKDTTYIGSIQTVSDDEAADMARGKVFLDANRNAILDANEAGIVGVFVSNGREVVVTDTNGDYELPAYDDMNVFISKPAGYAVPVDEDMIPQFNYVHKVAGSPDLRYGGIEATGPLPQAINFPLITDQVGDRFQCLVFGDPQPYTNQEVSYVRDTVGKMLLNRDNSNTECMLFEGDIVGDDLSLYPRVKSVMATGNTPQYYVAGNHDLDWDAEDDAHSFDTFRREWGPEYYSYNIGKVHFVVLDDVRYPCNGVDPHTFCDPGKNASYNGVVSERQLGWLRNDLVGVPQDSLIVLSAHIPFVTFTDATAQKHQVDNLDTIYEIIGDRPALGLSGHTHTTEQILPGESFKGWAANTNTGPAKFHQIITGAVAGSWWAGDINDQGVPHGTQRLGSPRGYYVIDFDGADYVDTYTKFGSNSDEQMHASFNTPRFRSWVKKIFAFVDLYNVPSEVIPPVTINDIGDMNMLTVRDLKGGSWVAVNVWNGSKQSVVNVSIDGNAPITATRTQAGEGEAVLQGAEYADPYAIAKQATQGRSTFRSASGGDRTAGFTTGRGSEWVGVAGPFQSWLLTRRSSHLWRADLPSDLATGVHTLGVTTTDRYGRDFSHNITFEVVEAIPEMRWQSSYWD